MKSPLNSVKSLYRESMAEFTDMSPWLKVGGFAIMLVGPNTDATITSGDKGTITKMTLAAGLAVIGKKAHNRYRNRHPDSEEIKSQVPTP